MIWPMMLKTSPGGQASRSSRCFNLYLCGGAVIDKNRLFEMVTEIAQARFKDQLHFLSSNLIGDGLSAFEQVITSVGYGESS